MGRIAYITRLALGRSAYETPEQGQQLVVNAAPGSSEHEIPDDVNGGVANNASEQSRILDTGVDHDKYVQQYDYRGHPCNPSSRDLSRDLIRCGNNCLATVGYVVNIKGVERHVDGTLRANRGSIGHTRKVENVLDEYSVGRLYMLGGCIVLGGLTWLPKTTRNYLQVFNSMREIPFLSVLKIRSKHFGGLNLFLAGLPAWLISQILQEIATLTVIQIQRQLAPIILGTEEQSKPRRARQFLFSSISAVLSLGSFTLLVYPTRAFSYLQGIGEIPCWSGLWPILPSLKALVPFSRHSPIQQLTLASIARKETFVSTITSFCTSPPVLLFLHALLSDKIDIELQTNLGDKLPQVERIDAISLEANAVSCDIASQYSPSLRAVRETRGALIQFSIPTIFRDYAYWGIAWISQLPFTSVDDSETKPDFVITGGTVTAIEDQVQEFQDVPGAPSIEIISGQPQDGNEEQSIVNTTNQAEVAPARGTISPQFSSSPSRSGSPSGASLRVRAQQSGNRPSEYLTMEVELSGTPARFNGVFTRSFEENSFSTSQAQQPANQSFPLHRLSLLSSYGPLMFSENFASVITTWILLPLETFAMRQVMRSFLISTRGSAEGAAAFPALFQFNFLDLGNKVWQLISRQGWQSLGRHGSLLRAMANCTMLDISARIAVFELSYYLTIWHGCYGFRWGQRDR